MRQHELPGGQRQDMRIRQQPRAAPGRKNLTEQKVAIAMHHRNANASRDQQTQCGDNLRRKRIPRIVKTIVARPGFEKIAKNEQVLGRTRPSAEKIKKELRDPRRLRRQMQVGNEQDQGG